VPLSRNDQKTDDLEELCNFGDEIEENSWQKLDYA
jgi:hypothetical protein